MLNNCLVLAVVALLLTKPQGHVGFDTPTFVHQQLNVDKIPSQFFSQQCEMLQKKKNSVV